MATTSAEAPVTGAAHAQFLARLPFFADVPPEELAAFAGTMLLREHAPGTDIVVQRQYGNAMFVLLRGAVGVHAIGHDDVSVKLARIDRAGDFFGEAALLGRGERTATVTAETEVVLLEIEKHRFDLFTRRHKSVRDHLEAVYHARAIATYLRTHRYLAQLDDASRAELAAGATLKLYQRGDVVTKRGDRADSVLVVKDGVVKALRTSTTGTVSILAYFNTDDVVGVNDAATREFGLEAIGQCEVIALPRNAFAQVMVRRPDVAAHFGKDDMHRKAAMAAAGQTVVAAAQAFLSAGVEVESLLVINLDRCVRCGNCVRACHARHTHTRLDRRGPIFRRRAVIEGGHHEHVMLPSSCRHCRDPECMIGCPTGAIQRFADGDVDINDNCIGCENCARKCPYGNITMRPLAEDERPSPEVTKRAIKCNLCRGHTYSNCVHECPRGAILRVDPLRYFEELALVMDAEQQDAIAWSRGAATQLGTLGTKQRVRPRSTWFIPVSFALGLLAIAGVVGAALFAGASLRGGSRVGLGLGIAAATCLFGAASQGVRKRMRNTSIGGLEAWTQFHMVLGGVGFIAAVAHAGFRVTGVFTTLLLLVFALEVVTGALGQIIYMTVPHTLTRLERHGLARLVEDLLGEETTLAHSIEELVATLPGPIWQSIRARVDAVAGTIRDRMKPAYDAATAATAAKARLGKTELSDHARSTAERIVESKCRLVDVRAQLVLHRRLKAWLIVHVATASALLVLLAFHVITALTFGSLMALRLSFETGAFAGSHIVTSTPRLRFGRDPQLNDILLTKPKVSRHHAVIERRGTIWSLEIVGRGPSKLNGDDVTVIEGGENIHLLTTGDRIELGGVEFTFAEATARLIVVAGDAPGREIAIDGPIAIGSGGSCDLVLAGTAERHVEIAATPFGFTAIAHGKVRVNGASADKHVLAHGDELVVGTATLRFVVAVAGEAADRRAPSAAVGAVGELVCIAGAAKGDRIALGNDQIILGTRADCTVVLGDGLASSLHCAVSKSGDDFVATDLGSATGTFVNGTRIAKGTSLRPGDLVAAGTHVFEARLIGGVTLLRKGATTFTTVSRDQFPQPRFVLDGRVVRAGKIVIGRAPTCELIVDDAVVSRQHCRIEFGAGFVVVDSSSHGTYVDDKRVVSQPLPASCVLRIGTLMFRVAIHGEVCTLERADAALAQAAVDVARRHATVMAKGAAAGGELATIFRMDAGAIEHEIAARKKDLRRGAPAWRPSSDLSRDGALRGAVVMSLIAAVVLCGGALAGGHGDALVNHPLSASHASVAFASQAKGVSVCASCHAAGARVAAERCATCHAGFAARAAHHAQDCGDCHREHEGRARATVLGAHERCAACHANQHAAKFRAPGPQRLAAGPLPDKHLDTVALHAAHSTVIVGGAPVGIGCTSCHASAAGTETKPGLSCFRCHQGGEAATATGCERCHGREHGTAVMPRLPATSPELAAALATPHPARSIGWALGLGLLGSSPGVLLAVWLRIRRRRRQTALVEELGAHPAEVVKRLVHSINDSKCVGCGLCVQACPASVLELVEHKSRVVNFDSCIQCKKCESACAFDALRMHDADKPPPMIPMPSIDAFHETPVAGMFLIGQASGTPQVKNATNLGRAVVQRMVQRGLQPGSARALGCDVEVVIVGSGPAGLSAALTCLELGLSYVVLEKEREFSWTIRNYYHKGKEVMAEPHDVALEASLPHWDTSREQLLGAWGQLVTDYRVDVRYQHAVLDVKKDGERFVVAIGDPKGQPIGQLAAARVVIAIGTLGNPRKLGCPGDDLEKVRNSLVDPDEWSGRAILVVGGSDSAVEVVLALCRPERRNRVTFSTRGAKLEGIKPKNRTLIEDALAAGQFEMRHATQVGEVTPHQVALVHRDDNRREELPNDVVFAMIGGSSPQKWLQQIGIPYVDKPHSWSPPRTDLIAQKTAEGLVSVRRIVRRT